MMRLLSALVLHFLLFDLASNNCYLWFQSGKLMRRICPKDVTINIGKDALIPECPIPGERF